MCGRFAMDKKTDDEIREFVEAGGRAEDWATSDWQPSWNIGPTDQVQVVRQRQDQLERALVRWDVVPPSSPVFGTVKRAPIFNARIETVATNGLFKGPFAEHRCIVPATGYYEWRLEDGGKQPYFIHDPNSYLGMAGIIRPWKDRSKPDGDPEQWKLSMAIITMDAHVAPGEVHDRMPACLTRDSFDDWLGDELGTLDLLKLLDRTALEVADQLDYYPVSKAVNASGKTKRDGPQLIEPITL